ncbi:MAG: peptide chain release factor N(5)-glutamine methyltransferase [Acidiferrobacterales bacterium]
MASAVKSLRPGEQAQPSSEPVTVADALRRATAALHSGSESPRIDAELLLMQVAGLTRAQVISQAHSALSHRQRQRFRELLQRRRHGEPIAYLTGTQEFWSMMLRVSPATLIPRPETELLVEQALARIPQDAAWTVGDIGTGCGAIALALAKERPRCRMIATDCSKQALAVARQNAKEHGLTNIELRLGRWLEPFAGTAAHVLVSNPPYVPCGDPHLSTGDVRFEPTQALVAGVDGLVAIRQIARYAKCHLRAQGWLLLEHAYNQAQAVGLILRQHGYRDIRVAHDVAGQDRVSTCHRQ